MKQAETAETVTNNLDYYSTHNRIKERNFDNSHSHPIYQNRYHCIGFKYRKSAIAALLGIEKALTAMGEDELSSLKRDSHGIPTKILLSYLKSSQYVSANESRYRARF